MSGELKKLKIESFKKNNGEGKLGEFLVMFNPTSYSNKFEIEYEDGQGKGTSGANLKFKRAKPQEFSFEFVLDGTGASTTEKVDVSERVDEFLELTYKLNGDTHRTPFLKVSWGSFISECVLKAVDVTYTLFKPDGFPLRAKVTAAFAGTIDDLKRAKEENKNSPDLTHHRTVKEGDTLPLMTYQIYGDQKYYAEIARINGLTNFRELVPGTVLRFPQLKQQKTA